MLIGDATDTSGKKSMNSPLRQKSRTCDVTSKSTEAALLPRLTEEATRRPMPASPSATPPVDPLADSGKGMALFGWTIGIRMLTPAQADR